MSWLLKLINGASAAQYDTSSLAAFNRQNKTNYRRWQDISIEDLRWYLSRYVMDYEKQLRKGDES